MSDQIDAETKGWMDDWMSEFSEDLDERIAGGMGYVVGPSYNDVRDALEEGYLYGRREFARLIMTMRRLQLNYFKTRDKDILISCKEIEKSVDRAIEDLLNNTEKEN